MKPEECGVGPACVAKNADAETGKRADVGAHETGGALPPAMRATPVPAEGVVSFELASVAERAATAKPRVEAKARRKLESLMWERPREGVRRHEWPVREDMREGARKHDYGSRRERTRPKSSADQRRRNERRNDQPCWSGGMEQAFASPRSCLWRAKRRDRLEETI
jgi:hypothetical protein